MAGKPAIFFKRGHMQFEELRKQYPVFYYHDYTILESRNEFQVCYDFEIEGLSHFNPDFTIPKNSDFMAGALSSVREAAYALGLVELVSYWKITCSPKVVIECGTLDSYQLAFWKKLYFNGLGEFFYKNKIETDIDSFMTITTLGEDIHGQHDNRIFHGNLIPVGGGKDSFVSLDLLKAYKEDNIAFVINHVMSAIHSAQAAGYKPVVVERSIDPRMLDFNKQGYLNGHTPFSALCAFGALLTALVYGRQNICLSNEASANESTVKGSKINHQYSKTFEFETDFNAYVESYITNEVHYFSLLRPLSELQIASIFATLKQYHSVFRSCNVGQKEEKWCGHCAKCLFVCIMLSAFLSDEELVSIFNADMLNDASMEGLLEQLSGMQDNKPFECVGTREEVNIAICMSIRKHKQKQLPLPLLYRNYEQSSFYAHFKNESLDYDMFNEENLVPKAYKELIQERLKSVRYAQEG